MVASSKKVKIMKTTKKNKTITYVLTLQQKGGNHYAENEE